MKRLFTLLIAVFLLTVLAVPATAAENPAYCIDDRQGLLTDMESLILEDSAQDISRERQCAVYFLSVEDYRAYGDGDIFQVARKIFLDNDLGMGADKDGVLLMLSMAERDYCLIAHGFGETALTDDGREYICAHFLDDFGDDNWYGGIQDYLMYTDELLEQAREGNIYSRDSWITGGVQWCVSLIFGALIALVVCLIQRSVLRKKVCVQTSALEYLQGDVKITRRQDVFSHVTEVRRKIEKSSSGSSGDHSHSSDGFSGTSGKF